MFVTLCTRSNVWIKKALNHKNRNSFIFPQMMIISQAQMKYAILKILFFSFFSIWITTNTFNQYYHNISAYVIDYMQFWDFIWSHKQEAPMCRIECWRYYLIFKSMTNQTTMQKAIMFWKSFLSLFQLSPVFFRNLEEQMMSISFILVLH